MNKIKEILNRIVGTVGLEDENGKPYKDYHVRLWHLLLVGGIILLVVL